MTRRFFLIPKKPRINRQQRYAGYFALDRMSVISVTKRRPRHQTGVSHRAAIL